MQNTIRILARDKSPSNVRQNLKIIFDSSFFRIIGEEMYLVISARLSGDDHEKAGVDTAWRKQLEPGNARKYRPQCQMGNGSSSPPTATDCGSY
jgi:hypothetical protein